MEVFSIAHPEDLCYSLVIGQVAFPCLYDGIAPNGYPRGKTLSSRLVGFMVDERCDDHDELKQLSRDLHSFKSTTFMVPLTQRE